MQDISSENKHEAIKEIKTEMQMDYPGAIRRSISDFDYASNARYTKEGMQMIESNIELNCDSKNSMSQSDVALNSVSLLQGFQIKKNKLDLTKQFKPSV